MQAVIFDMDGVLLDSEPFWSEAEQQVFAALGVQLNPELLKQTAGLSTKAVTALWFAHSPWVGTTLEEAEHAVTHYVSRAIEERGIAKEGLIALLKTLRAQGIPMAVATNSPSHVMHTALKKLNITEYFQALCAIDEVSEGKPAPDIYLLAATRLNTAPNHCLVFEDSVPGLTAALRAGMQVIALPAEHHWQKPDYQHALLKIKSYHELPEDFLASAQNHVKKTMLQSEPH